MKGRRKNGMGASREAALMAKLEAAEKERDALRIELNEIRYGVAVAHDTIKALRAKVEAMERQEPVGWFARIDGDGPLMECKHADISRVPLYTLPGAQPAQRGYVPASSVHSVIHWLRNGCDPMKAADELEMLAASREEK